MKTSTISAFDQFALKKPLLKALTDVGYETPSPIQAQTIPVLLEGRDAVGQAQTGTGKTAAFALPILSNLDVKQPGTQVLVLTPTRELAIQVAEAFQKYATHMKKFHVLPIYGGQDYRTQLRALQRGVHVVVGTPGRVMDHMRRGTLVLNKLRVLVLDEADEMLRMGFIDDVEWILEKTPEGRQTALFSATMPKQIRRIAAKYLNDPAEITVKVKTAAADTIRQRYWPVSGPHKLDALTRILEAETFDAMLVFVRTKTASVEIAEKLAARGYACAPLNGDIVQRQRERTVAQLKSGKLDIIVATDVAARGLDVERFSHVINYDIPHDTEAYVHRIGRTGRAGRTGDTILFVAPREKRMLHAIEKATNSTIELMDSPSTDAINKKRIAKFHQRISDCLENEDIGHFAQLLEQYRQAHDVPALKIAAALAKLLQGDTPMLLDKRPTRAARSDKNVNGTKPGKAAKRASNRQTKVARGWDRYRIEVGHDHQVKPSNIVGAIANEAGLDSQDIGRITIFDDYSEVDLPAGMPKAVYKKLRKTWVAGQRMQITCLTAERDRSEPVERTAKDRKTRKGAATKPKKKVRKTTSRKSGKRKSSKGHAKKT